MTTEFRVTNRGIKIEKRDDGGQRLSGYAAVFHNSADPGTEYQLWETLFERINPNAFDRALKEKHDVRALFNHDGDQVLGRFPNTLRLSVDSVGLRYEIDLPNTQTGQDVAELVARGDISGSSFAFVPTAIEWRSENDKEIREVKDLDLIDVGPVTFPAYTATSVGLRSQEHAKDELARVRAEKRLRENLPDFQKIRAMEIDTVESRRKITTLT